ncbi:MAG: rolling circle replication-associated protein [Acidimicrobiales bacterium]
MADEFTVKVTRTAMRLARRWQADSELESRPLTRGGGTNSGEMGPSTAGRVINEWTTRSQMNMRWEFSALDWEALGRRPAMISLTYPGDWQRWVPSGPVLHRHREAFKERWRRRWGEAIRGVWVREFQERGAPHLHLYVGLPNAVTDADYQGLVRRTMRRKRLERQIGKWQARREAGFLEGEFGEWLLAAWSGCVGTVGEPHARFGADVAPFFWTESVIEAAAGGVNWGRVASYLWNESGKWGQKKVPEDFAEPGRAWGKWGGLKLIVTEGELTEATAMELRRPLWEMHRRKIQRERSARGLPTRRVRKPRGKDGLTVHGERDALLRLLSWAQHQANAKLRAPGPGLA